MKQLGYSAILLRLDNYMLNKIDIFLQTQLLTTKHSSHFIETRSARNWKIN